MERKTPLQQPRPEWLIDDEIDVVPGTEHRPLINEPFDSVLNRTMARRTFLKAAGTVAAATFVMVPGTLAPRTTEASWRGRDPSTRLTFETVPPGNEVDIVLPPRYEYNVIARWGDPILAGAPSFDVNNQTAWTQAQQFGFNADLVLWAPLPLLIQRLVARYGRLGNLGQRIVGLAYPVLKGKPSRSALMIVNHEYTTGKDMFPDYDGDNPTRNQVEVEIEAHGFSIIQVDLDTDRRWQLVPDSPFNRRVTGSTPIQICGPLRGHPLMQTSADPQGVEVLGCLNNCAGGKTPWGTYLTCEENFDQYFANFNDALLNDPNVAALSTRIAAPGDESRRKWERFVPRFDLSSDAAEYNRFGYIVEIDPYDPSCKPKKRTAMGRYKHEGAALRETADGRIAVYSGDDARFEYVYKFVSNGTVSRTDRKANSDLLDDGTLYVARFDAGPVEGNDMGTGEWLELSPNNPALSDWTLEEILVNTRGAADLVEATPMDRPEDVEVNPVSGSVYVAMTNNSRRDGAVGSGATREINGRTVSSEPDESNPRNDTYEDGNPDKLTGNQHGHIIEIAEDRNDAGAMTFSWTILVKCGDPAVPAHNTSFGDVDDPVAAGVSPISDPDNLVHDSDGNLWIATDGQYFSGGDIGFGQNDGIFAVPTAGENRGLLRQFLSGIPGGEVCGPEFSGDEKSFFCAIQHPWDGKAFSQYWPLDEAPAEGGDGVSKPSLIAVHHQWRVKIGA